MCCSELLKLEPAFLILWVGNNLEAEIATVIHDKYCPISLLILIKKKNPLMGDTSQGPSWSILIFLFVWQDCCENWNNLTVKKIGINKGWREGGRNKEERILRKDALANTAIFKYQQRSVMWARLSPFYNWQNWSLVTSTSPNTPIHSDCNQIWILNYLLQIHTVSFYH